MYRLRINGDDHEVDAPGDMPLLWVLRDLVGLTGTKYGCGIAQCGACTVHLDGRAVRSCVLPVANVGTKAVTTIEAVGATTSGQKIQQANASWPALPARRNARGCRLFSRGVRPRSLFGGSRRAALLVQQRAGDCSRQQRPRWRQPQPSRTL